MTISEEQWAQVAADLKLTLDELKFKIQHLDNGFDRDLQVEFDRDLDPLTFGEWAMLFESPSYRFIRVTVLPTRYAVLTIWQGLTADPEGPPVVMETAVFRLDYTNEPDARLPPALYQELHLCEQDAIAAHERIVGSWAVAHGDALSWLGLDSGP